MTKPINLAKAFQWPLYHQMSYEQKCHPHIWDGIRSEKMNEVLNHNQVQPERCHRPYVQSTSYLLQ
ncbi:hypothetical protein [Acinetobacter pittii]|uniref:Uncharacterized protein n=1 Tax=Acinetobacter pittii TaxID=48296 RepID=A0A6H0FPF6_ACIPI|nr:hypothetical protein [Acinetobacter pittii]QIT16234.1 hypothetical protein G8E09_07630 [Acinetobacter pittii]